MGDGCPWTCPPCASHASAIACCRCRVPLCLLEVEKHQSTRQALSPSLLALSCTHGRSAMAATKPTARRCSSPLRLPRIASQPPRGRPRPPPTSTASRSRAGMTCGRAWPTAMADRPTPRAAVDPSSPTSIHQIDRAIAFLAPSRTSWTAHLTGSGPAACCRRSTGRRAAGACGQAAADRLPPPLGHPRVRDGTAMPALPLPAAGTGLTGRRMAGRQASSTSSVLNLRKGRRA
jgi:hypothetical protein